MTSIAFIPNSLDISGGTAVIFEHATGLRELGYEVTIITEDPVDEERLYWFPEAKRLDYQTYDSVRERSFDICFATWWRTVYELPRVQATHYAYFNQSVESRFYPASEAAVRRLADATYMLPLSIITEVGWIARFIEREFGREAQVVRNGIDKDIFRSNGPAIAPRSEGTFRVLVEGPLNVRFKNVPQTIELARQVADEVWLATSTDVDSVAGVDRVFSRLPMARMSEVYRSCDVLVKLSYVEGMFGPPLEMFHCGGTAVIYDVTGHEEYVRNGGNAFVVKTDDEEGVVEALRKLKSDRALLSDFQSAALETAAAWPDWKASTEEFAEAVERILAEPPTTTRAVLRSQIDLLFGFYALAEKGSGAPQGDLGMIVASLRQYPLLEKLFNLKIKVLLLTFRAGKWSLKMARRVVRFVRSSIQKKTS